MPKPDQIVLRNDAIAVEYNAASGGRIHPGGPIGVTYTDGSGNTTIPLTEIQTVDCGGAGTLVTVTLSAPRADGTVFSMLLPAIELRRETSACLQVPAITAHTGHPPRGEAPQTTYSVTLLTGTAYRHGARSVGPTGAPAARDENRCYCDLERRMPRSIVALANVT